MMSNPQGTESSPTLPDLVTTQLLPQPGSRDKGRKWEWTLDPGRRLVEQDGLREPLAFNQMTELSGWDFAGRESKSKYSSLPLGSP